MSGRERHNNILRTMVPSVSGGRRSSIYRTMYGNHLYLTKEGWRKVIELEVGEEIAVTRQISGYVSCVDGSQYTTGPAQMRAETMLKLWQTLVFSFPRINNYTNNKKDCVQRDKSNSKDYWQSFKEVTKNRGQRPFLRRGEDETQRKHNTV